MRVCAGYDREGAWFIGVAFGPRARLCARYYLTVHPCNWRLGLYRSGDWVRRYCVGPVEWTVAGAYE